MSAQLDMFAATCRHEALLAAIEDYADDPDTRRLDVVRREIDRVVDAAMHEAWDQMSEILTR